MRAILSITLALFWAVLSAIPKMDAMELAKLPVLWAHYQEHATGADEPVEDFADFLLLHYGKGEHSDRQEHGKLPFKAHHGCVAIIALPPGPVLHAEVILAQVSNMPSPAYPRLAVGKASRRPCGVWQPPKLA